MSGDSWYQVNQEEGGKIWENGIETCKISCMKREKKKIKENNQGITQSHVVLWRTFQNIKVINFEKMKL